MNRKTFLKYSGAAGLTLVTGGLVAACAETTAPSPLPTIPYPQPVPSTTGLLSDDLTHPLALPGNQGVLGVIDMADGPIAVTVKPASLEILSGKKTQLLTYEVAQAGKTFVNPVLRVVKGATFQANIRNTLDEATNIHWHGLHLDWHMDGHPSQIIRPGSTFTATFAIQNRGGTYWYHPHPDTLTAKQAYKGLAGFFIVEDADTQRLTNALDLTFGVTDIPVVIQDKLFDSVGNLVYLTDATTQSMGLYGDTILANLTPQAVLDVDTRIYRFRLLNGSNARTYRLAFVESGSNATIPYALIGTDGGFLDTPYPVREVFLSPGERIDVLLDVTHVPVGSVITLTSLAFDPMHNEMGGGGMGNMGGNGSASPATPSTAPLADGQQCSILTLRVRNQVVYSRVMPQTLSQLTPPDVRNAQTRAIVLSSAMMGAGSMMRWMINGQTYAINAYPIEVKQNSTEIWELRNEQTSMPHPMHLHGFQFQVLDRRNSPTQIKGLVTDSQGRMPTDRGWKDTVLVWPGETVRIALQFVHTFVGEQNYVTHCHILEHEDNGMMLNYRVV